MKGKGKQRDFISRTGTMMTAAAWLIFLAFLFGVFDYFVEKRINPNQNIATSEYHVGGELQREITLTRNAYGHYVSSGTINSEDVVFLLDTGATQIAIPERVANRLGLVKQRATMIKTANGDTRAYQTHLNSVAIGDIRLYDLRATILENMSGDEILLGMNFLKHFEIVQKGKMLTIRQ